MRLVLVTWLDSNAVYGWRPFSEHDERPSRCETVGFLMDDAEDFVRLAFTRSEQDNIQASVAIPRKAISGIEEVAKVKSP